MPRKTFEMTRGNPGIPRKKRSPKDAENVKKAKPKEAVPEYIEMTFESDDRGLFAMMGHKRMPLSPYGSASGASVGETWRCMIDHNPIVGDSLLPINMVMSAPAVEEVPYMADDESAVFEEAVPILDAVSSVMEDPRTEELRAENEKLREINRTLKSKADRVDMLDRENDRISEENKTLKRTNESLVKQVKSLNGKDSVKTALSNESLIRSHEETIESKDYEILLLREKLKSMGVDDLSVVPHMPKVPKAFLTGEDAVHCTFLEDGRYSVYVSPRTRKIRVVPDESGRIWCRENTLHLRCIAGFSDFEKPRPLVFTEMGDAVEIEL